MINKNEEHNIIKGTFKQKKYVIIKAADMHLTTGALRQIAFSKAGCTAHSHHTCSPGSVTLPLPSGGRV